MQRYTHSGIVPVSGAITTVLVGLTAAVLGGLVYAVAAYWISWGIMRLVMMGVYAAVVGVAIGIAANAGKIRSPLFITVVALVCAGLGLWTYWGGYDVARNGLGVAAVAWTPDRLVEHGQELFKEGTFTLRGKGRTNGWLLAIVWVIEAVCVTFIIVALARTDAQRPFCESCLAWTGSTSGLLLVAADGNEPPWQEVLAGDLTAIAAFQPADPTDSPHVRLDLARCPKCQHSNFVTLTAVTLKTDSKGNTKTIERQLLVNGLITDPEAEFLNAFSERLHGNEEGDEKGYDEDNEEDGDGE
jgi:hypothetical protein